MKRYPTNAEQKDINTKLALKRRQEIRSKLEDRQIEKELGLL